MRTRTKIVGIAGFCGLFVAMAMCAEEPSTATKDKPDPKAIVQKSAEAISKLKVVSYDLEYKVSGFFEMWAPNLSGPVVMGKESPDHAKRFSCKLKFQKAGSSDATEVTAGADGTTYYFIDDKTKTVHADIDSQVLGKNGDTISMTLIREFGMAKPFEDALKSGEMKYVREQTVDGHDCHVISFKSAVTMPEMDWYISKTDYLPRGTRFAMKNQGSDGAGEAIIHNLKVDPKLDKDPFALVVPEGYKRTDEFAK
ncbi:MAG: DUF2092 domain-containing protein [Planctomycetes bacterium]|nr:DUF2092 domain-containing protein [Planctomycetota bacterium]